MYYLKVEVERAAEEFRQALAAASTPLGHYYLGLAQAALGQVEEACASYRKALQLDGKFAPAQVALGRALLRLNQVKEAGEAFEAAVALDPTQSEAHYQLGLMALERGDPEEAEHAFEAALSANPQHQGACYNLSLLYQRRGEFDRARQMRSRFEQLLKENLARARARTAVTKERAR